MDKKRIMWIDQLKGIAFFFVILGHTAGINAVFKSWIYSFHMPLYFITGGFHYDFDKVYKTSFKDYFIKTFKGFLVPYVWLNFLCIAIRYIIVFFITHKPLDMPGYMKGILLSNTRLENCPSPTGPTYFILLIALSRLALWFITRLCKTNKAGIGICCVLFCCASIATPRLDLPWHINVVPSAMLMTYIGRIMMEFYLNHKEKLHQIKAIRSFAISLALFSIGAVLWKFNGRVSFHANYYGEDYVVFLVSSLSTVIAFTLIIMKLPHIKPLAYIGANTLFALAVHDPIIRILETAFRGQRDTTLFSFTESALIFLLMIPAGYFINRFMPYINGKSVKTKGFIIELFKFLSVAAAGFGPCNYFINNFGDGILESTTAYKLLSYCGYLLLCVVAYILFNKVFRFMFNQQKASAKTHSSNV